MPRPLSPFAKKATQELNDSNAYLTLLEISHEDLADDILIVNNSEDIVSNGKTYQAFPFEATLPDDDPDEEPSVVLEIGNVDRKITDALLSISSPANAVVKEVLSNNLDSVEIEVKDLLLRLASYDALKVSGSLVMDDILSQAFPRQQYTPTYFKTII